MCHVHQLLTSYKVPVIYAVADDTAGAGGEPAVLCIVLFVYDRGVFLISSAHCAYYLSSCITAGQAYVATACCHGFAPLLWAMHFISELCVACAWYWAS